MGHIGVNSMKNFHAKELEEAIEKYAKCKFLGRGGNGIVYKGSLVDNHVVAIKNSQMLDQGQREQLINEMSSNILLEESYTAKIVDFGASRLVLLGDHDQVTKLVQGTLGYLDPEYLRIGQLTDKIDVYSFGVKKPIAMERCVAEQTLATCFEMAVMEDRTLEIIELEVVKEGTVEQLKATCELKSISQLLRLKPVKPMPASKSDKIKGKKELFRSPPLAELGDPFHPISQIFRLPLQSNKRP
ncbi:hypothetical protein OSB04_024961 [Centaurea solstitialis]|uniref:Protein kinase domain-containing protein n=1 Tax=Centaurea solstitialis TaxID=347529 RepID=A0AA38WCL2_9ASTR|nr:hypothetical protein OSB04_024961 [Centaurea solstitialis]